MLAFLVVLGITGRTSDCFSLLTACITSSIPMRANPQGGLFHVSSSPTPQIPMSEVCNVFSTEDLTSNFDKQPRVMTVAYIVLEVSWTPLTHSLIDFSCIILWL